MLRIAGLLCGATLAVALVSCGGRSGEKSATTMKLPASGREYRALHRAQRTAVAVSCRDRIAGAAGGLAARELRATDARMLREQMDADYLLTAEQSRPVAQVCHNVIRFVTPGLRVSLDGAKDDHNGGFSIETSSGKLLSIRGRVTPAPPGAYVIARRDVGPTVVRRAAIGRDGRFALPAVRLRKVADNTFTITFRAGPHAPRKVLFTAICLDCLSGGPPPGSA